MKMYKSNVLIKIILLIVFLIEDEVRVERIKSNFIIIFLYFQGDINTYFLIAYRE
jgi:hypothetical protein